MKLTSSNILTVRFDVMSTSLSDTNKYKACYVEGNVVIMTEDKEEYTSGVKVVVDTSWYMDHYLKEGYGLTLKEAMVDGCRFFNCKGEERRGFGDDDQLETIAKTISDIIGMKLASEGSNVFTHKGKSIGEADLISLALHPTDISEVSITPFTLFDMFAEAKLNMERYCEIHKHDAKLTVKAFVEPTKQFKYNSKKVSKQSIKYSKPIGNVKEHKYSMTVLEGFGDNDLKRLRISIEKYASVQGCTVWEASRNDNEVSVKLFFPLAPIDSY